MRGGGMRDGAWCWEMRETGAKLMSAVAVPGGPWTMTIGLSTPTARSSHNIVSPWSRTQSTRSQHTVTCHGHSTHPPHTAATTHGHSPHLSSPTIIRTASIWLSFSDAASAASVSSHGPGSILNHKGASTGWTVVGWTVVGRWLVGRWLDGGWTVVGRWLDGGWMVVG